MLRSTVPTAWILILTITAQCVTFTSVTQDDPIGGTTITRITAASHVIVTTLKILEGLSILGGSNVCAMFEVAEKYSVDSLLSYYIG